MLERRMVSYLLASFRTLTDFRPFCSIPSKAMLNNSHIFHQTQHDTKGRGIDGGFLILEWNARCRSSTADLYSP